MKRLNLQILQHYVAKDPRIDPALELDEPGKAIVWLRDGWTWNAQDGNRTVEAFYISKDNADEQPVDTVAHLLRCITNIEPIIEGDAQ